jgi:hypothetical protein
MKNLKAISALSIIAILIAGYAPRSVFAEGGSRITASPSDFIILENELGKKTPIVIKNSSAKDTKLDIAECISTKIDGKINLLDQAVEKSVIDVLNPTITVKANSESTINVRVRISASGKGQIPCIKIYSKTDATITPIIIPFIIQNFAGSYKVNVNFDIGNTGLVTSPSLTISGKVANGGDKFFKPQGVVTISKNGQKLNETDITSQITGLLMSGEEKPFEVKWTNDQSLLDGIGEYTIEVKVTTDQSSDAVIKQLYYNYLPQDLLLIGGIGSAALLLIIIGLIVLKKR